MQPVLDAYTKQLEELHPDLALLVRCVKNESDPAEVAYKRVVGGFRALLPFKPIYFRDSSYRRQRHDFVRSMVSTDEKEMNTARKIAAAIRQ
jgi:hypothetical protein